MRDYGYVRVGAIVNKLALANPLENAKELIKNIKEAYQKDIAIVVTPELALTGYTCADLFLQDKLIKDALEGLKEILKATKTLDIIAIIGMPLATNNTLYNTAVVINKGKILGIVPKSYIPNYNEFYEDRWFSSSLNLKENYLELLGQLVPFGTDLLFQDENTKEITFAIEICEDLWSVVPPSSNYAVNGATIIFNLSSSNELIGKDSYRQKLIASQSARTVTSYIYTSSGMMESSSDLIFGGASYIYENGKLLKKNERFQLESNIISSDIDIFLLTNERRRNRSFMRKVDGKEYRIVKIKTNCNTKTIDRIYAKYPFVPNNNLEMDERCLEIINIQSSALARRLIQLNNPKCIIGMSGGLDSTLAFLVIIEAFKKLGRNNKDIIGITMPGFGTTNRTYQNALDLVKSYNATLKEISIKEACLLHMKDITLDENDRSITYENLQARERTQILMDVANKEKGIVIGTGDLSELALGWCTYNGDHMSMYAVNIGVPKTLIRHLVNWYMEKEDEKKKLILTDILETPISPELLPPDKDGNIAQKTENSIGSYILHDFFLYHFLRYGTAPKKLYYLAKLSFPEYNKEEIIKCLKIFINRFFTQQFKRNCLPDGVKVGSISLSPRGDLRLPSDLNYQSYLDEIEKIESSEKYE